MNALLRSYPKSTFTILGFPSNQFGHQEPGANSTEILNGLRYVRPGHGFIPNENLHLMKKCDLNGLKEHPLYKYLKESCPAPSSSEFKRRESFWDPIKISDIEWNFEKFIVSPNGVPIFRLRPHVQPYDLVNLFSNLMSPVKDIVSQKQQLDQTLENLDKTLHHREFHSLSHQQQEQNIVKSLKELRKLGEARLSKYRHSHYSGKMYKNRGKKPFEGWRQSDFMGRR